MKITRGCLQVLAEFRNPAVIITKNHLVTRDIDVLGELAHYNAAAVAISITTLDRTLARKMEPRASTPDMRYKAVEALSRAGIPVSVMIGLIMSSAFPAIVVYAQELVPGRVGMISGLFYGLSFGVAAIGAAGLGWAADVIGIVEVYRIIAFLPAIGLLAAFLPKAEGEA